MSRRDWFPLIALAGGLAVAAVSVTQSAAKEGHGNASTQHQQNVPAPNVSPQPSIPLGTQNDIKSLAASYAAINARADSPDQHKYNNEYLQSQKDMARNAGLMFWVGVIELLITFGGVLLVGLTLKAARTSAAEAGKAAKEAKRQANIAEAGLRPHLFVDNVRLREPINANWLALSEGEFASKRADVFYDVKNFGRSPAIIKELKGGIYIGTELPVQPTPNPNDVWTDEIVISTDNKERGRDFFFFYRRHFSKELLLDLVQTRSGADGFESRFFFFVEIKYEGPGGTLDEFGVLWEHLVDIGDWIPCPDIPNYTYRRLGSAAQRANGQRRKRHD